jgi:hypothetical protein
MAAQKPPASQPLLMGDDRQTNQAWSAWFDAMAAEIAALKARLAAAGIP